MVLFNAKSGKYGPILPLSQQIPSAAQAPRYDAVVVGAGPNGLAAAIELARSGFSVKVFEARNKVGGGAASEALTLPGFVHDVCSAIHPLAAASPFFNSLPLMDHGLQWVHPEAALAHPFDDGTAALVTRCIAATAATIAPDAKTYVQFMDPLVDNCDAIFDDILRPLRIPGHVATLRFGARAIRSARGLILDVFAGGRARALFAGAAAHGMLSLERAGTAAFGLVLLMLGHRTGWPMPAGGAQAISDALAAHLVSLGGTVETGTRIDDMGQLPDTKATLFDVTPRQLLRIAGTHLPAGYRKRLHKYRYGPGVFKMDWALSEPIPWKAQECKAAGTLHLGGGWEEIARSEREVEQGRVPESPFVLVAQQSLFDRTRAPAGKHTGWAYCHVPNGSGTDMTQAIESQIERFAPGFKDTIVGRSSMNSTDMERHNPNYVGGDINGGMQHLGQVFFRPVASLDPYHTGAGNLYLCSSSTPPGGGVHGMCGFHAARSVLRRNGR